MIDLIIFLLACYGATNIITGGKIFEPVRDALEQVPYVGYWISCPMCMGVPVGIVWALAGLGPETAAPVALHLVAMGAISSGFCWIVRVYLHSRGEDEL